MTRVKICCIADLGEARLAIDAGAAALGLVSAMPSGPGVIDDRAIAAIAAAIPPGVASFLLTSRLNAVGIIAQQRAARVDTIQLVDRLESGSHRDLRSALPGIGIVQVIHVTGDGSIDDARRAAPSVDALLLDSGNPALSVKELGGTGRTHDWSLSQRIVNAVDVPVWLAGGLHAANVEDAIRAVRPFGVDLCSGVRTDGRLDEGKLSAFVAAVRRADGR